MIGEVANKIITFLEKEKEKEDNPQIRESLSENIKYFKTSKGQCHGTAVMQAYGRRISDEDELDNAGENSRENQRKNPKDDAIFFKQTKEILLNWNGEDKLGSQECSDIERFISKVMLYQRADIEMGRSSNFISQGQIEETLDDPVRGKMIKSFECKDSLILTREMVQSRLEEIVKPCSMVFLHPKPLDSGGHTVAIYQDRNDKLYLFNNYDEICVDNFKDLTKNLWDATNAQSFRGAFSGSTIGEMYFRNIEGIEIYRFSDDPEYQYPKTLEIKAKEFIKSCESFNPANFADRDSLSRLFLDSISSETACTLFQGDDVKDESLKTALLSKTAAPFDPKYKKPLFSAPPMAMTKEMLFDRLEMLDKEEICRIKITYEIDNKWRQLVSLGRGYSNEDNKPLSLILGDGKDHNFDNMKDVADCLWKSSSPSNFRTFGGSTFPELHFRKYSMHVFEGYRNTNDVAIYPSSDSFKPNEHELSAFNTKHPDTKDQLCRMDRNNLAKSFFNQFELSKESNGKGVDADSTNLATISSSPSVRSVESLSFSNKANSVGRS